ncbi:neuromedin-U receptor 2-like [Acanthaster planci]|uniref:Neuromedin-U receptor 2-like n=1 Tax=Acanthaster planci TaxID=133434 RepID=A0A8B7ZSS4_ACAPL|nr:neuromedin-U receptor 2-like [Acanthaster planci]
MNASHGQNESGGNSKWMCQTLAAESVVGVLGNLLVCFVILRVKFLHNMTNYLLVNLAVADMLVCLQAFFYHLVAHESCALLHYIPSSFGGRELYCRLLTSRFLTWAFSYASAYCLSLVTLERYVAIVYPLKYERKLTTVRMKSLIALAWAMSVSLSMPFLFTTEPIDEPDQTCSTITYPHQAFPSVVSVVAFVTAYLLPVILMTLAYYKMQATLKRQAKALNLQHARAAAYDLVIARQRLVSMLIIVLGALLILWAQSYIGILICLHPTEESYFTFCGSIEYSYVRGFSDFAFYLNSAINPVIYEFKYKKFRQGLKAAFCPCSKRHGNNRIDFEMAP